MRAITIATGFVAIAGYLIIWIAAKALTPGEYVDFMVFWGLFFALTGLIDGLMQETTRGVTAETGHSPRTEKAQPFRLAGRFGAVFAVIALVSSPLWASQVSPDNEVWGIVLFALGLASFAFQAILCGLISATSRWAHFAWLIAIDSGIRLTLALLAWWAGWGILAFLLITVIGAATWGGFVLFSPSVRSLLPLFSDVSPSHFISRSIKAMLASGANAVLITGFPVLLRFTTDRSASAAILAGTITAVTLTRAPLLVPLQRFQPALIVHFTKNRHHVLRTTMHPMAAIVIIAAIGGVAAWLIGQPIMALLFDEDYLVSPVALGLLTLASGGTALLMVTGSAALAAERHNLYWLGWAAATAAAIMILFVDASPDLRAVLALGLGPLTGVAIHLGVLAVGVRNKLP